MFVNLIIAVFCSNTFLELIKLVARKLGNASPERMMLKALGADRLYSMLCDWKHADDRPASEWETIDNLYKGYKALGGNGEISKLYKECAEIETTD